MSMFSKLKEIQEFRSQAKKLQEELAAMTVEKSHKGVTVTVSADMRVQKISTSETASPDDIRDTVNEALAEAQKVAAHHMQNTGGLRLPGM